MAFDINDLYPHQREALGKLSNGKILRGGVGSGKTRVAAAYYVKKEAPKDVYVITTAKKRDSFDWQEEFYRLNIGPRTGPVLAGGEGQRTSSYVDATGLSGTLQREVRSGSERRSGTKDAVREDTSTCVGGGNDNEPSAGCSGNYNQESNRRAAGCGLGVAEAPGPSTDCRCLRDLVGGELESDLGGGHGSQGQDPSGLLVGCGISDNSTSGCCVSSPSGRKDFIREGTTASRGLDVLNSKGQATDTDTIGNSSGRGRDGESDFTGFSKAGHYPYVLTVDSWNNIAKYADVSGAFFIFDEQRLVGSGDWARKFLRIAKRNNWILLTATPGDAWMDFIPVFVANNFYKNRTDFKRQHVVYNTFTKFPKVDRYIGVGQLLRNRNKILVDMPFERHTKRHVIEVPLAYDKDALEMVLKKRWNVYENRPLRDVAEMFLVGRKLVNSDPSRLEMVLELWKKHPKLIIFYNFNFELEALRRLASPHMNLSSSLSQRSTERHLGRPKETFSLRSSVSTSSRPTRIQTAQRQSKSSEQSKNSLLSRSVGQDTFSNYHELQADLTLSLPGSETTFEIAEWNGHRHEPIPSSTRWIYLVQYTAGAEGWNCITTDATVMYSRHYSWRVTEQARGRIDRMNTPFKDLYYYDFTSESFIDKAIGRALKAKKTFNESQYKSLFVS